MSVVRRARGTRGSLTARLPRPARLLRRSRSPRPGRLPGPLLVLLGSLPGLMAVLALALCAHGVQRPARIPLDRPAALDLNSAAPGTRSTHLAGRPLIVPRSAWLTGTAAGHTQPPPRYDDKVIAVFVHHTDSPNGYRCADTPEIIRRLYAGQTGARKWDDIGYNFLVDRCGTIYEGRAGGTDRAVVGAHAQGFNHRTAGIAAIGTFTAGVPVPRAMTDAIAALAAWKLGLADIDPRERVRLVSSNGHSRFRAGTAVALPAVAGHNDGFMTSCPGAALTARLPEIRETAARLQGRAPTAVTPRATRTPATSRTPATAHTPTTSAPQPLKRSQSLG
ncbi:peptidoglycan recognition protein [Streptomyces malaysiense]|uniref:peptidoglycan recognition protein family protein n=1 Tax=Streptomyces malaysiense TaxID=1428626 RepID=UPI000A4919E5|nr:peptidoglycan recognition protein [Streptomyces malaysiense]